MLDTIIKGFFTGLVEDMKTIPHTAISVLLLWLTVWGLYFFVWPDLSNAQDQIKVTQERQAKFEDAIGSLSKTLLVLNSRLVKEDMERQLAAIEREKDDIERDVARMTRAGQETPIVMQARLQELKVQKARKEREITAFIENHPELQDGTL